MVLWDRTRENPHLVGNTNFSKNYVCIRGIKPALKTCNQRRIYVSELEHAMSEWTETIDEEPKYVKS